MEQTIRTRIIEFLKDNITLLPLDTASRRRTFLYEAIPEYQIVYGELSLDVEPYIFVSLLIQKLENYEIHGKGQGLIVAVLQRARNDVGEDAQQVCDVLTTEWQAFCQIRPLPHERAESSPDHEYDVFLSYDEEFEYWVKDPFLKEFPRLLEHFLEEKPRIYQVRHGEPWTPQLKAKLRRSCCIVPIWCPGRFTSDWWTHECAVMFARETRLRALCPGQDMRLIFPVVISDCKTKPQLGSGLEIPTQSKLDNILDCIIPGTALKRTPKYGELVDKMQRWIQISAVSETIRIVKTVWGEDFIRDTGASFAHHPSSSADLSKEAHGSIWGHRHG